MSQLDARLVQLSPTLQAMGKTGRMALVSLAVFPAP
jgi:hypothetical protein